MKTSLFAIAVLMSFAIQSNAATPPPIAAVQITPAAVVKPVASAAADQKTQGQKMADELDAQAKTLKPVQIVKPVEKKKSTDSQALQKLFDAQNEFKKDQKAKPAVAPATKATTVAKPAPIKKADSSTKPAAIAVKPVEMKPAQTSRLDEASVIAARCSSLEKGRLTCMNRALERAWERIDSKEVRLANCNEKLKIERDFDPQMIEAFIMSRMNLLRLRETQAFNSQMASLAPVSKMKAKEIELRAMLDHLVKVTDLSTSVCDSQTFAKIFTANVPMAN